jgi:hypothetical protein
MNLDEPPTAHHRHPARTKESIPQFKAMAKLGAFLETAGLLAA